MRIYLVTDLEGVAGVLNFADWCTPNSRYYELAKELLTNEVNAAIEGFFAGGAEHVTVADRHGHGGINPVLLDTRVELSRGFSTRYPLPLDDSYDLVAWVGQHAKACTEYAHLAHTLSFNLLELSINGLSIGEIGRLAMCAAELGVRCIFLSGDRAACKEAQELIPGIETVSVKRGTTPGKGDELDTEQYARRNTGAIHIHPEKARAAIREGAERAVKRAMTESFGLIELAPPFERVAIFRAKGEQPRTKARETHSSSVIALMNLPFDKKPLSETS